MNLAAPLTARWIHVLFFAFVAFAISSDEIVPLPWNKQMLYQRNFEVLQCTGVFYKAVHVPTPKTCTNDAESQGRKHALLLSDHMPHIGSAKCTLARWYQTQAQAAPAGAHTQVAGTQFGIKTYQRAMFEGRQARLLHCWGSAAPLSDSRLPGSLC